MNRKEEYIPPALGIGSAKEIIEIINDRFDGTTTKEDEKELAVSLGHETDDSGAFRGKLSDLKKYGLLEGWGEKSLTPLAYKFLEDRKGAIPEVIDNISLFKKAYQEFGNSIPNLDEWRDFLNEGEDIEKTKRGWKLYNELARKLPVEKETRRENQIAHRTGEKSTEVLIMDIKKHKKRQKKVNKTVLDFLKEHEGRGFTAEELADRLGVPRKHIRAPLFVSPFAWWKISREYDDLISYYYAERRVGIGWVFLIIIFLLVSVMWWLIGLTTV